jgi:hypothetical protein
MFRRGYDAFYVKHRGGARIFGALYEESELMYNVSIWLGKIYHFEVLHFKRKTIPLQVFVLIWT